jgi:uncharacterized protein YggE
MKNFLICLSLFIGMSVFAQSVPRTISVQASASVSVNPDLLNVRLTMNSSHDEYKTCIDKLNQKTNKFTSILISSGVVKKEQIKTVDYTIRKDFRYNRKNGQNEFKGFIAQHYLLVTVENSKINLNKILTSLASNISDVDFSLSYASSKAQESKDEALAKAVRKAKKRASIMIGAAGTKMGDIVDMNYGSSYSPRPYMGRSNMMAKSAMMADEVAGVEMYNPQDIKYTETVTITWEIK